MRTRIIRSGDRVPAGRKTVAKIAVKGIVGRLFSRAMPKGLGGALALWAVLLTTLGVPSVAAMNSDRPQARLDIALAAVVTSLDPHYHRYTPNQTVGRHIFDPLLTVADGIALTPALALSWENPTPLLWRFNLRPDVTFHDGHAFTAADVAASLRRPGQVPESPFSLADALSHVTELRIVDDLTIEIHTDKPMPNLPRRLANFLIIPTQMEQATDDPFATAATIVGTGPYRLTGGDKDDRLFLSANKDYWGRPPEWDQVVIHVMPNDARRLTALLDGTVDVIESVPPIDAARLMANPSLRVSTAPSTRVIYLGLDIGRQTSPYATGRNGEPIANPLRNPKVRQAIDQAIDRTSLLRDVLQGYGSLATQLLAPNAVGHVPDLEAEPYSLSHARALMTEAGYPKGFRLTIHCPRNRYVADIQIARSVSRMLDRLGIETDSLCLPTQTFFRDASEGAFSMYLAGLAIDQGDATEALSAFLGTPSPDVPGRGALNRGGWGDAETDRLIGLAVAATSAKEREGLVQEVIRRAAVERGVIPLFFQQSIWAMRADLQIVARSGELTLAQDISRVNR